MPAAAPARQRRPRPAHPGLHFPCASRPALARRPVRPRRHAPRHDPADPRVPPPRGADGARPRPAGRRARVRHRHAAPRADADLLAGARAGALRHLSHVEPREHGAPPRRLRRHRRGAARARGRRRAARRRHVEDARRRRPRLPRAPAARRLRRGRDVRRHGDAQARPGADPARARARRRSAGGRRLRRRCDRRCARRAAAGVAFVGVAWGVAEPAALAEVGAGVVARTPAELLELLAGGAR